MLNKLCIYNFKCFYKSEINLSKINLFCGPNSSGKSTAIQALLLIAHNAAESVSAPLNGQGLSLGSFNESRNFLKNAKSFKISVTADKETFEIKFIESDDSSIDVETDKIKRSTDIEKLLDYQNKHIFYLHISLICLEIEIFCPLKNMLLKDSMAQNSIFQS